MSSPFLTFLCNNIFATAVPIRSIKEKSFVIKELGVIVKREEHTADYLVLIKRTQRFKI